MSLNICEWVITMTVNLCNIYSIQSTIFSREFPYCVEIIDINNDRDSLKLNSN